MRGDGTIGDDTTDDNIVDNEAYCPTCGHSFAPVLERCPDDGTRLIAWRASADPLLGSVLDGRFRIVRPLGAGGMGTVYEAVQLSINRSVALKVVRDQLASDRATVKRFLREARLLVQLSHHNIVAVYDYGQTATTGTLYLVMELLRGPTLAAVLARAKRLPAHRACEIALQLCDALAAAHVRDIVHRDLKPENVLLTDAPDDVVKVLDFGLAKSLAREATANSGITQAGTVIGTPLYMAPEAITGDAPDLRSDLYALGCLLFEMLLGAPPYVAESINVILARHLHEPVPALPDDVPLALRDLVTALLAKEPAERPQTARIVHARLAAILATLTPEDEAPTLIHTPRVARGTAPPPVPLPPQQPPGQRPPAPIPATLPSQPPPPVRATIRALPPPAPAPVRTSPGATQILGARVRRLWPVIVMSIVVAIAVFAAVVIALGP